MLLNLLKGFALIEKKAEFVRRERFEGQQIAEAVSQCPFSEGNVVIRTPIPKLFHSVHQNDPFFFVDLAQADFNDFRVAGLHASADVLGLDRHFAMAALDRKSTRLNSSHSSISYAVF